jgi:ABC-type uncharacterized transport system permease subunit
MMLITSSIVLYCLAWALGVRSIRDKKSEPTTLFTLVVAASLISHGAGIYQQVVTPNGYNFSIFKITSLFFWVANLLILLSSLRKPLHNLLLITIPISVIAVLFSLVASARLATTYTQLSADVALHIFISIFAYSTMIVATVQTILLAFQNHQLRNKHTTGLVRLMPPLQTMETLLFELLWVGEALLTLVIITGAFHINDIAHQHLAHKIVFTCAAWLIYGTLLWGRHFLGWRGNSAIRWSLAGFASLILAYIGSQLVLEMILSSP